jgi:hypothetical protein
VRTLRAERCYERLDITGLTGITDAQRQALLALGAVEDETSTSTDSISPGQSETGPLSHGPRD